MSEDSGEGHAGGRKEPVFEPSAGWECGLPSSGPQRAQCDRRQAAGGRACGH